jgi:O-antigen/teichoic acid export membrane protein
MSSHEALRFGSGDDSFSVSIAEPGSSEAAATINAVGAVPAASGPLAPALHPARGLPGFFSGTLFRKGALSLFDQAVVSATNFLTMVLLGRTAEQELGVYQLAFSIVLLATCVQNALISSPYTLFGNRMEGKRRAQYAGSTLMHQGALSALATLALAIAAVGIAFGWGPIRLEHLAWVLAVMLPFILVREFVRRVAFAHLQLTVVLALDITVAALQLGGLIALKANGMLTASTAFGAIGVACALAGGATFFFMRRRFAVKHTSALSDLRRNWTFGKWAFGAQVLTLTSAYCIPWMLALLRGTAETGRYSACLSLVLVANPLLIGLNNFLSPQAVHAYHSQGLKGLRRLTWGISLGVSGVLTVVTILLVLFGGKLLTLVYGQKLTGNELPVAILALNMIALAASLGVENGLVALNRPSANFWSYLAGQIVTLAGCFTLIVPYGVVGAALASFFGIVTATAVKFALFNRECRRLPAGGHL